MSIDFRINEGVGIFTTTGDVDYQEGMGVLEAGLQELKSYDVPLILFDLRYSKENRTSEELRNIAQYIKLYFSKRVKIALLAKENLYYGLSAMFATYVDHLDIEARVFKKEDDALSWLKQ